MICEKITAFVKSNIQHFITGAVTIVYLWLIVIGRAISPEFEWAWRVIMIFWFGYTAVQKAGNFIKAATLTDPKATNGTTDESKKADGQTVEQDTTAKKVIPAKLIPKTFDSLAFTRDVNDELANTDDYAGVNTPSTQLFAARDKIAYRWRDAGKLNNNVATLALQYTILDYAKRAMAFVWSGVLGKKPTAEFNADPIKYVNDHFADFRSCPSCKQPVANQQVDIKWLADSLGDTSTKVSYTDVLNAQKEYNATLVEVQTKGLKVWKT